MTDESPADEVIVQDIQREVELARLTGLKHRPGRAGHDAEDDGGHPFELKTTTQTGFGTARDVSLEMIKGWRSRYWVFGKGRNLRSGFVFEEIWFLSPEMMDGWFRVLEARFAPDIRLRDLAVEALRNTVDASRLERVRYLFNRGMTYNNPKIPIKYVREHGKKLDPNRAAAELKELLQRHPLRQ